MKADAGADAFHSHRRQRSSNKAYSAASNCVFAGLNLVGRFHHDDGGAGGRMRAGTAGFLDQVFGCGRDQRVLQAQRGDIDTQFHPA